MEWSEDMIAKLRRGWAEGKSSSEIGRDLGLSKNAVVGKVDRLNLPPRENPVHADWSVDPALRPQEIPPHWLSNLWTLTDIIGLLDGWFEGLSVKCIAAKLHRSEWSVTRKVKIINLPKRHPVFLSAPKEQIARERDEAGYEPLPAGHPISLTAIGMTYQEFIRVR